MSGVAIPAATCSIAPTTLLGAVYALLADLHTRYPEAGPRVEHGAFLALFGRCESDTATSWWVGSERDPHAEYFVLPAYGTCTCQDHARHGHLSPCKHRLAVELHQRCERSEAEALDPSAAIALELTDAAYVALDALGEVPDVAPQCPRCHAEPRSPRHPDGLGAACVTRELYGDDPDAA